jgi:tetraacyldisaccharide 4'-kinase
MSDISPARGMLRPLVPLYRFGLFIRERQLASGGEPIVRLGWPVVSVGNLSAGGAGKTPLTIALARAWKKNGSYVDVLSRGYGRKTRGALRVNPEGTAEEFGDEPLEIARAADVPVYVASQRYDAGVLAEREAIYAAQQQEETAPQRPVHLLDDGFQHRQLARDVDIVLVNRRDFSDELLPAGNLREPLTAILRAHIVAIPEEEPELENKLKALGWTGRLWHLRRRMEAPDVAGPVVAFCGIAQPEQFFAGLEAKGIRLAARRAFPDHYRYGHRDVERLAREARTAGATLVTTEKDRARLGRLAEGLPLETAKLCMEIPDSAALMQSAPDRIERSGAGRA